MGSIGCVLHAAAACSECSTDACTIMCEQPVQALTVIISAACCVVRNVTITGLPGAYPVLDLNRQTAVVRLCGSCTLRIVNASIANATRQGVGRLTFFSGQSGSRIVLQNGYEMLLACPSPAAELAAANQTQRSQLFPHPRDGMQLAETANAPQLVS